MTRLYKNKYRVASARLQSWDYSQNAAYFVTICVHDRICRFGDIVDGNMQLSEIGMIADRCWLEIPDHFPFVILGNHVVMPNHVHGIVIIDRRENNRAGLWGDDGGENRDDRRDAKFCVSTNASISPPSSPVNDDTPKNKFGPQSQNLASIIRGFKVGVTKGARLIYPDFKWQPRYHDHIIRDNRAYQNISEYIINNPRKWDEDVLRIK